ncbi:MAG: hypothetical protein HYX92_21135 [Chloroflexi bacterium]|nr:hypothetical protein [Chloroflexota bacterium]
MRRQHLLAAATSFLIAVLLGGCAPPTALTPPGPAARPTAQAATEAPQTKAAAPTPTVRPMVRQPKSGGTLLLANRLEPAHFDMHQDTSIGALLPLASSYSLLIQNDPMDENKIIGDLAKSWEVGADSLTYTFRLHEGVKFHNGAPLTAGEVKFNLDRIVFPPRGTISARKDLFRAVDKIEAVDPSTVRVTLKHPQPSILTLLAMPFNFIFPPEVIKAKGDMKRDVVGSGPFKFSSYIDRISFSVKRNPDYFIKGRPYLDGITIYIITDARTRSAALQTKRLHMLPLSADLTPAEAAQLTQKAPSLTVHERVQPSNVAVVPNIQVNPWGDLRVRQAVNLVMDRELGGKTVRAGYFPGYGYTMPNGEWSLAENELMAMPGFRKPKDQDVAEAKRLLSEAGYAGGFRSALLTLSQAHHAETAEFAKDQLAKVGITADIQIIDSAAHKQRLLEGRFEIATYNDSASADDPDIILGESYLTEGTKNWGKWSSSKYDELYAKQTTTVDKQSRVELAREMQRLLHREAPKAIVAWARRFAAFWPEVKDYVPAHSHLLNNKFQDVWLDR